MMHSNNLSIEDLSSVEILKQLIAIPSQNPMGAKFSGDDWLEGNMSRWLCDFFEKLNIPHQYIEIEPNRGNVVALLQGDPEKPIVFLDAHQDTVPVAGMTVPPFKPTEKNGRIYGRGACDVKGPLACILSLVAELKQNSMARHATTIVSCTCDEEFMQLGAKHLNANLQKLELLKNVTPDYAIVSEPTELNVVVAHKGTIRWKITTHGKAAHSSQPLSGENAIYKMAGVINGLQQYASELSNSEGHPLCGTPTLSVGTIQGGQTVNSVPSECTVTIDRRLIPGETADVAMLDAEKYLRSHTESDFEMSPPFSNGLALSDSMNLPLANQLVNATNRFATSRSAIGVAFTTHAPRFEAADIPTVVFGPGSIAQAHTADEWIDIDSMEIAKKSLLQFLIDVERSVPDDREPNDS